jgi:serine/threonine protein kinase
MGVCTRPPNLAIVTEFCDNGSLHDVLKAKREEPHALPWMRRLAFAADAARGVTYLHSSRPATIHADLNTSNLLVDRGWRVKVADFGLSRLLTEAAKENIQGTNVSNKNASHLAPEVLRSEPYGTPSDVFSFGCVLWALATLCVPWERLQAAGNHLAIAHLIAYQQQRLPLPAEVQPPFEDLATYNALIAACFAEEPTARPRMESVLETLVQLQQATIRRHKEAEAAAAAARDGGPAPAPTEAQPQPGVMLRPGPGALGAAALWAARAAEAAQAAAAQWQREGARPPAWMLVAAAPLLSAGLAWLVAKRVYARD